MNIPPATDTIKYWFFGVRIRASMSANPTRVDWEAAPSEPSPLQQGNRVLESIARQEALRALLAFSDLHEQIRNRRAAADVTPIATCLRPNASSWTKFCN